MDINKSLFDLILVALEKEVVIQIKGEPITIDNYLTTDYFSFVLDDKQYDVTFKEKFHLPGKQIEHIRRGSNFIKDLLSHVFNNYNLLFITNSASNFTLKNIFMPPMIAGMSLQPKAILGEDSNYADDYEFQISFLINIRDTITGFTTNKKIISEINVLYNDDSDPVYLSREKVVPALDDVEEIKMLQPDTLMKLQELTARLRLPEEKEKILNAFLSDDKTDLSKYIDERENIAVYEDSINFDYNVTPIAIYAIKSRMTNVEFTAIYGSRTITQVLKYNHVGEVKYKCPNCNAALKRKLVLAKGKNSFVLACEDCATMINEENSVYDYDGWYLSDEITNCIKIDDEGNEKSLKVLLSDVDICQIDKRGYYKEDLICYDYIKSSNSWFTNKNKYFVHKRHANECKNCQLILVGDTVEEGFFNSYNVPQAACVFCVGKEKTKEMKKEYFLSEYSKNCYPLKEGIICVNCGKLIAKSEAIQCKLCQEFACVSCHQEEFCIRCQAAINSVAVVARFPAIWKKIKNNFLIHERRKKKLKMDFRKNVYSSNMELRVACKTEEKIVLYYFHQVGSDFIYIRRKKYDFKREDRAETDQSEPEEGNSL